jgi:hypothetical protein
MQIDVKDIESLLMSMVFLNNLLENIHILKNTFPFLYTWELAKYIPIWSYNPKGYNFWNLHVMYRSQL